MDETPRNDVWGIFFLLLMMAMCAVQIDAAGKCNSGGIITCCLSNCRPPGASCHCDKSCEKYGDCCEDYVETCKSPGAKTTATTTTTTIATTATQTTMATTTTTTTTPATSTTTSTAATSTTTSTASTTTTTTTTTTSTTGKTSTTGTTNTTTPSTGDHCSPNPCVHGKCINSGSSYICKCDDGWEGSSCAVSRRCSYKNPPLCCTIFCKPPGGLCSCDNFCTKFGDCCPDYKSSCEGGATTLSSSTNVFANTTVSAPSSTSTISSTSSTSTTVAGSSTSESVSTTPAEAPSSTSSISSTSATSTTASESSTSESFSTTPAEVSSFITGTTSTSPASTSQTESSTMESLSTTETSGTTSTSPTSTRASESSTTESPSTTETSAGTTLTSPSSTTATESSTTQSLSTKETSATILTTFSSTTETGPTTTVLFSTSGTSVQSTSLGFSSTTVTTSFNNTSLTTGQSTPTHFSTVSSTTPFNTTQTITVCCSGLTLNTANIAKTSVQLTWSSPTPGSSFSYVVLMSGTSSQTLTVLVTAATFSSLIPGSRYMFKVTATTASNVECCSSSPLTVYTVPEVVKSLRLGVVESSSVQLKWSPPVGNKAFYLVYMVGAPLLNKTVTTESVVVSNLNPVTTYTFQVFAVAADNVTKGNAAPISAKTNVPIDWCSYSNPPVCCTDQKASCHPPKYNLCYCDIYCVDAGDCCKDYFQTCL